MKPTTVTIYLAIIFCLSGCKPTGTDENVSQSQIADLKREISEVKKELEDTKRELEEFKKQSAEAKERARNAAATQSAESSQRDAVQKIYRELIKLNAATESGVTYAQYSERVLNAKTEIDSVALALDDEAIRKKCLAVFEVYQRVLRKPKCER